MSLISKLKGDKVVWYVVLALSFFLFYQFLVQAQILVQTLFSQIYSNM